MDVVDYLKTKISIHALRGEGDHNITRHDRQADPHFNPRPPWGGRLTVIGFFLCDDFLFQSTPSVGRATNAFCHFAASLDISIHALRGEGDAQNGYA